MARFANLLARYTGDNGDEEIAARAMRYLATWDHSLALELSRSEISKVSQLLLFAACSDQEASTKLMTLANADTPTRRYVSH